MSARLPKAVAGYLDAANAHAVDAALVPFAEEAVVKDEGREHRGREAIRAWMEETARKYGPITVEVKGVAQTDGQTVASTLVAGNFPGSPARLRYTFTLDDHVITRLEIG